MSHTILIIDDDQSFCELLKDFLKRHSYQVVWITYADQVIDYLQNNESSVILVDLHMPKIKGTELCRRIKQARDDIPVIVMTAFGSLESAVEAIRAGAYDFITKPIDNDLLLVTIERALKNRTQCQKIKKLTLKVESLRQNDLLLGESQPMQDLSEQIHHISQANASVLITGESGTGKELVARAIHNHSCRNQNPYITINCSAIPEHLLESELFGHRKGSFTNAYNDRKGLFLQAHTGTLFLDEIGDLPLSLQPKLLRVLEDHSFRSIGSDSSTKFDIRFISATNKNLESLIQNGLFRDDLFYRIHIIQLQLPALRNRGSDILLLAHYFINHFSTVLGKAISGITEHATEKLYAYSWPGNVRELKNICERAVTLAKFNTISTDDLPEKILSFQEQSIPNTPSFLHSTDILPLEEIEKRYILHVLKSVGDNRTQAAKLLKLDRKTLYRKLLNFNVH